MTCQTMAASPRYFSSKAYEEILGEKMNEIQRSGVYLETAVEDYYCCHRNYITT